MRAIHSDSRGFPCTYSSRLPPGSSTGKHIFSSKTSIVLPFAFAVSDRKFFFTCGPLKKKLKNALFARLIQVETETD